METAPAREVDMGAARLPKAIVEKAVIIARRRDITVGEYLGGVCEKTVDRDYRKTVAEMNAELGESGT